MHRKNKVAPSTKQLTSSELQKNDKQEALRNIPLIDYMVLNAIKKSNPKIERLPLYEKYKKEHKKYHDNEEYFEGLSRRIYDITKIESVSANDFENQKTINELIADIKNSLTQQSVQEGKIIDDIELGREIHIDKYDQIIDDIELGREIHINTYEKLKKSHKEIQ